MSQDPFEALRGSVRVAAASVRGGTGELPVEPRLERPKRAGQGDYSTNAAMLLAPVLGRAAAGDRRTDRGAS